MCAKSQHVTTDWSVFCIYENTFGVDHWMSFLVKPLSPRYSPVSGTVKG